MGQSTEWRFLDGSFVDPGPARVWARTLLPLVAGEQATGLQRTLVLADSANALSAELDSADWMFIPPGLTLVVVREPQGEWLMLDARSTIDSRGSGMAHTVLLDENGQFGVSIQPLLVQRRQR